MHRHGNHVNRPAYHLVAIPRNSLQRFTSIQTAKLLLETPSLFREMRRILSEQRYSIIVLPIHFDIRQRFRIPIGNGILLYEHLWYNLDLVFWHYFHLRFYTLREAEEFIRAGGFCIQHRMYRPIFTGDMGRIGRQLFNDSVIRYLTHRLPTLFASGIQILVVSSTLSETHEQKALD